MTQGDIRMLNDDPYACLVDAFEKTTKWTTACISECTIPNV